MKKAISIWSFSGKTVKEAMDIAKAAGFDGIEIALNETGELSLESSDNEFKNIKDYSEKIGLPIHSLACGLYWNYSLTSNDEATRDKALSIANSQLLIAKKLGAEAVLIVPGAVGIDFMQNSEVVDYDIAYERSLEAFLMLKSKAQELKIHIGIENVWNKFLLSPLEMCDFIDKINSPFIGAYLDVGNVIYSGYPEQWIKILGSRIKRVHFKDYRRAVGGLDGFVDLLSGDVNWAEVMLSFERIGYNGWATAEMLPPYAQHSEQIIFNTSNSMNKILGR